MDKTVQKKIVWQKWIDPLNSNIDEVSFPELEENSSPDAIEYYDFADTNVSTSVKHIDDEYLRNLRKQIHSVRPLRVVNTRMGLLTVTENAVADYHFDFWTMHTNFPISDEVARIVCKAPGVDSFMPLTRYRCRVGFPKSGLFDSKEVKLEIQRRVFAMDKQENILDVTPEFPDEVKTQIDSKIEELKSKGKFWALYVLPNGGMEALESDSGNDTYISKLKVLEESQKLIGGQVFRS